MKRDEIKNILLSVAKEAYGKGPGWSQEGVVLREVGDRISRKDDRVNVATEQTILEAWHDLFTERILAWGYNLDNPGSPFFHIRLES